MNATQISLTPSAAKRVAWIAERQCKPAILRLAVDGGGCAGFTYKFELAPEAESDDAIAETGATSLRDLGRVMADVMPQVAGRADGSVVSQLVREKLA